jgi:hypothetical protein
MDHYGFIRYVYEDFRKDFLVDVLYNRKKKLSKFLKKCNHDDYLYYKEVFDEALLISVGDRCKNDTTRAMLSFFKLVNAPISSKDVMEKTSTERGIELIELLQKNGVDIFVRYKNRNRCGVFVTQLLAQAFAQETTKLDKLIFEYARLAYKACPNNSLKMVEIIIHKRVYIIVKIVLELPGFFRPGFDLLNSPLYKCLINCDIQVEKSRCKILINELQEIYKERGELFPANKFTLSQMPLLYNFGHEVYTGDEDLLMTVYENIFMRIKIGRGKKDMTDEVREQSKDYIQLLEGVSKLPENIEVAIYTQLAPKFFPGKNCRHIIEMFLGTL